jgi:uncharacterized protein (DUF736 family)
MAIIGTFTKSSDGFTGTIKTLTLNVKAKLVAADRESDKSPNFRLLAGAIDYA